MLRDVFKPNPQKAAAEKLHKALVKAARRPGFYADYGVPDTLEGRFELIVLHAALVMRRLRAGGDEGRIVSQKVFDVMFADFDAALREMGVGDSAVGKRLRSMGEAFYGRAQAYDEAIKTGDAAALSKALIRNAGEGAPEAGEALAAWTLRAEAALAAQPAEALVAGEAPDFPPPE